MRKATVLIATLVLSVTLLAGCSPGSGSSSGTDQSAPSGEALVNEKCVRCHSLDRVQGARKSAEDWEATVSRMQGNGLKITDAEKTAIVDYLAKTYPQ